MLTDEEFSAVNDCARVPCVDEWCDNKCALCSEKHVTLGDALAAIDAVRSARRNTRDARLSALLEDT